MAMKETVLITGASAGIGEALAKEFAAHGHDLVLAARRAEPMEELAEHVRSAHGVEAQVVALDVTHPDAVEQLRTALGDKQVSILVNNAGVLSSGWFVRMDGDDIESMLTLNIVALTRLCHAFGADMVSRGRGRILNVASIAAFQPMGSMAVYAATKAYVLSLSEALFAEMGSKNVTVTALCPGVTDTAMYRGPVKEGTGSVPAAAVLTPEKVAADGYRSCMAGDPIQVPGATYKVLTTGMRMMPRWLNRRLVRMATRSPKKK